jgi:UDP-N-acetylglucosamine 2-epimerase (non-hydrolysing)
VDPIGYREFIGLGAESRIVISDSGGIQEEVSVYKRPAVVIRRSTERPEVDGTFVRRFEPGPDLAENLAAEVDRALGRASDLADIPSPYGDADAPKRCVDAIRTLIEETA